MLINDQLSVVKEVQPSQGEQTPNVHVRYFYVRFGLVVILSFLRLS